MNDTAFRHKFDTVMDKVLTYMTAARDSSLQCEAVDRLDSLLKEARDEKELAIQKDEEDYANFILACESAIIAVRSELKMWVLLKEEDPNSAWDQLIDAQMACTDAVRAHDEFSHFEHHVARLEAIEKLVFPPQVFVSSGVVVKTQECSICGNEYEECSHLLGRPYMGKFCYVIARDLEIDHISVVKQPADKRCRVRSFTTPDGLERDRMTWVARTKDDT